METASGLLATPSVVTPPPELPVRVTAPPELISTNFDTVALIVTVPVVDCAKHVAAEMSNEIASSTNLFGEWGIVSILEAGVRHGHPAVSELTAGNQSRKYKGGVVKNYSATTVNCAVIVIAGAGS